MVYNPGTVSAGRDSAPNTRADYRSQQHAGARFRRRFVNKKVEKKLVKHTKKAPAKTIAKHNKSAIQTLSRQVRLLTLQKYGNFQKQTQFATLAYATLPSIMPTLDKPVAFLFNSFYSDTPVYRGEVNALGVPTVSQITTFDKAAYDVDLQDQYQYLESQNSKITVSKIQYLPCFAQYQFNFKGLITSNQAITRYRITIFRLKRLPPSSSVKNLSLPSTLGALWKMSSNDATTRNYFSPSYHQVLVDKWVTFRPPGLEQANAPDAAVTSVYKNVNIPFSFPVKPIKMNLSTVPPAQKPWTNIPEDQQIWCLISCSADGVAAELPRLDIQVNRKLSWRDPHDVIS